MSESDWKTFRKMVPELRERYLKKTNEELKNLLLTPDQTPTERFWNTHEKITKEAKILHRCLDGHSRSRMASFIYMMLDCGLMDLDDLSQFSDELRESAKRWFQEEQNYQTLKFRSGEARNETVC